MAIINLQPGWDERYNELVQMFLYDDEVHVIYDRDNLEVKVYVNDAIKADALYKVLKHEHVFGNVTLKVTVVPPNALDDEADAGYDTAELYEAAFAGNPVLSFVRDIKGQFSATYVVFIKMIAQFFNDNLEDVYGNKSMLYADMAKDIFAEPAFFCTDIDDLVPDPEEVTRVEGEVSWP